MKNKNFEMSSGNVFKDLGLPNPEERLAKAKLAVQINSLIEKKKLTQKSAAKLLGINQVQMSALRKGGLARFSLEKLFGFLNVLGQVITIKVTSKTRTKKPDIDVSCDKVMHKPVRSTTTTSRSAMLARKKR